jgi:hypothetical protein
MQGYVLPLKELSEEDRDTLLRLGAAVSLLWDSGDQTVRRIVQQAGLVSCLAKLLYSSAAS